MGITAWEIYCQILQLKKDMEYWQLCQPWLVSEDLFKSVDELATKVKLIVDEQNARMAQYEQVEE